MTTFPGCSRIKALDPLWPLGYFVSSSFLDDAYVALRKLLGSKTVSPATREQVQKTIRSINQEAIRKAVFEEEAKTKVDEDDTTSSAAD